MIAKKGNLDREGVSEAICNGFQDTPEPCEMISAKLIHGEILARESENDIIHVLIGFFAFVGALLVSLGFMYFSYKRKVRKEIQRNLNQEVNSSLSKYYQVLQGPITPQVPSFDEVDF